MPSSGYSKVDIAALKAIPSSERVDGSSWLVRQNHRKLPSWYTWISADTSPGDDESVVIPADNPTEGRFLKADGTSRKVLSGDRTYYVSVIGGNNKNDGLTPETSFATIQKFIDTITSIDLNGFNINCQVIPGNYNQSIQLKEVLTNGGIVVIDGGSSDNTIIQTTSECVWGKNISSAWHIRNLTFSPSNGNCASFFKCSDINLDNCNFVKCNLSHVNAIDSALTITDCDISGRANNFVNSSNSFCKISTPSGARNISGSIAFEDCYILAQNNSQIIYEAVYLGTTRGTRYKLRSSLLDLKIPENQYPGSLPGIIDNSQIIDATSTLVNLDDDQLITGFKTFEQGLASGGNIEVEGNLTVTGVVSCTHIKNIEVDDSGKAAGKILKLNESEDRIVYDSIVGNSAIAISDEGIQVTPTASSINFTGNGVTATNNDGAVTVTIPGSSTSTGSTGIDATTTSKGTIQLAGDLGGTASVPTIATNTIAKWNADQVKGVIVDDSAKGNGKVLQYSSASDRIIYADAPTGGSGVANGGNTLGTYLTKTSPQQLLDQTVVYVNWQTAQKDEIGGYSSSSPSRLRVTNPGWYGISCTLKTLPATLSSGNYFSCWLYKNRTINLSENREYPSGGVSDSYYISLETVAYLDADDYVEVGIFQRNGATLTLDFNYPVHFSIVKLAGSSAIVVSEEGNQITSAARAFNFTGNAVQATNNAGVVTVNVSASLDSGSFDVNSILTDKTTNQILLDDNGNVLTY